MSQLLQFVGNHPYLVGAFTLVLLASLTLELSRLIRLRRIEPVEAVQMLNRENAAVIDIRDMGDFKKGHIIDAVNAPERHLDEHLDRLAEIKPRPVIVCCSTGLSAGRVASRLSKAGFAKVYILKGGIQAWREANLPLD
ncbi:MAG: rhodanese-like domain-containing protein [Pseudomonadota bacterium]|nr:rhodanese-like domain-containing protein [Pseudomonadota bacterium]